MRETPIFSSIYRASNGSVGVPAGIVETEVLLSLDVRRRRRRFSIKKTLRDFKIGEIRFGSTLPEKPSHRLDVLGGPAQTGTVVSKNTTRLLEAVRSYLQEMDKQWHGLEVEYGLTVVLDAPTRSSFRSHEDKSHVDIKRVLDPPLWNGYLAGLQFSDDLNPYTLWSCFGVLDLIKHDPDSGDEIDRTDIRSHKVFRPTNAGEVRVLRDVHDLNPLRDGLLKLRDLLETTPDEIVEMMTVHRGRARENMERTFGMTLEEMGQWPDPEELHSLPIESTERRLRRSVSISTRRNDFLR